MSLRLINRTLKKLSRVKTQPLGASEAEVGGTPVNLTPPGNGVLPTLICEMIIDCIAGRIRSISKQWWGKDTLQALRACSLTCRAWTPRSQYHLFRFLSVRCSEKQVKSVIVLLTKHPALRSHIDVLVLRASGRWTPSLTSIPHQLCDALPEVRELRISQSSIQLAPTSGLITSLGTFKAITTLNLYATLFGTFHDIRRIVVAFPSLEAFVLDSPTWHLVQKYPSPVLFVDPTAQRLKVLRLSTSTTWLWHPQGLAFAEWLARSGIISSVATLAVNTVVLGDPTYTPVLELIQACAKSVETLSISFGPDFYYSSLPDTLARCTKLRAIGIRVPYQHSSFAPLIAFLARPRRPITTLLIHLREYPQCTPPTAEAWRSLDEVLQGPQWSSLRILTLTHVQKQTPPKFKWGGIYADLPFDAAAVAEQLRRDMPLCVARGIMWNMLGLSGAVERMR